MPLPGLGLGDGEAASSGVPVAAPVTTTATPATAITAKIGSNASGAQCAGGLRGLPGAIGRPGGFGPGFGGARFNELNEVAKALGITTAQLQQDLQSGKTVQQLASAQGMDETAFRTKLASVAKTDLDQQVKSGAITQNQENGILQQIQNGPLPLWNGVPPKRFGPRTKPSPQPSPSATP